MATTPALPNLMAGSAGLAGSNFTKVDETVDFKTLSTGLGYHAGTYIRYGVCEHDMGANPHDLHAQRYCVIRRYTFGE